MFNIKSAVWAGKNYLELNKFKTSGSQPALEIDTPDKEYLPATAESYKSKGKIQAGDQMLCNTCSLQLDCKYYREGAVCSVPGAEPAPLAVFFKTRDSDMILEGLSTIMATQTRRLEQGMRDEETFGELDPEVTKILNGLFDRGVTLAKLVDPSLRGGPKVGVYVGAGGQAQVGSGDPRVFVGGVIRELEARGIPRDQITPALVQTTIEAMSRPDARRQAIEGEVIRVDNEKAS
jgi:hypothetical protein